MKDDAGAAGTQVPGTKVSSKNANVRREEAPIFGKKYKNEEQAEKDVLEADKEGPQEQKFDLNDLGRQSH